jgi:hypothetical protein
MGKSLNSLFDFTAGEVSPKVDARVDAPFYRKAMRQCQNVIPYKTGGFTRRPGTHMIAPTKLASTLPGHNYTAISVPFVFSPDTTFDLEFGNHYIRFYSNGQQVTLSSAPAWVSGFYYSAGNYATSGVNGLIYLRLTPGSSSVDPSADPPNWVQQTILEIPSTPYNADAGTLGPQPGSIFDVDIRFLQFEQINDVIYITHPDYTPCSLTRYGDTDWIFGPVEYITPALLDQNATDTSISASAISGINITLTATAPAWSSAQTYTIGDSVTDGGLIYNCVEPNVSSASFANDLSSGYWVLATIFEHGQEGGLWQLAYVNNSQYLEYDGVAASGFANGTSGSIQVLGGWEVHTYGVWSSDIAVQQSVDQGRTWTTVAVLTSRSDANYDVPGTASVLSMYQFVISNSSGLVGPIVTAGSFIVGETYTIATIGSTNFTSIGASANTVGLSFVATGVGSGTGTAALLATGATNPRVVLTVDNAFINGIVQINTVPGPYSATAQVISPLLNTGPTTYWSEAAWSNYRGFPAAVTAYQQRMVYGGSGFQPQRIWGTVSNDLQNFNLGDQSLATDSYAFDLNAPSRGPINWLIAQLDLFVGFAGAEWVVNSGSTNATGQSSGAAVTPTSVNAVESSSWGSAFGVSPEIVGDVLMFTQRQATSLRQMLFSVYSEKYMTKDLTQLADHLFASGIVQIAYQSRWRKQSLLWCVTQQGTLVGMTYELDEQVTGWHRHTTGYGQYDPSNNLISPDNGFESVSVIPGKGLADDEVWCVVNRLIGGVQTRFMERIDPNNWEETFTGAPNPPVAFLPSAFYVDCGMTVTLPGTLTITGLSYLDGRYVVGLADGNAFGPLLVSGGSVTLPSSIPTTVTTVQIGLPISYAGQAMRMDADPERGNLQGTIKELDEDYYIRVWNSVGGSISNGTVQYPNWISGYGYSVGINVISPLTQLAYQCVVATSGTTDPSNDTAHWVQVETPVYMPPVPIKYTPNDGNPFAVPVMVTVPTDKLVPPLQNPSPDHDPIVIIQGNDALPITILALIAKVATP